MYSSKSMRISFRLVSTFTDRVSGEEPMNRGGVSSFGPPEGEPWRAQERIQNEIKKNTKKRIVKNCCKLIKNQTVHAMVSTLIFAGFFDRIKLTHEEIVAPVVSTSSISRKCPDKFPFISKAFFMEWSLSALDLWT